MNPLWWRAAASFLTNRLGRSRYGPVLVVLAMVAVLGVPLAATAVLGFGLVAVVADPANSPPPAAACLPASVAATGGTLSPGQLVRARQIVTVGQSRSVPTKGVVIALAVGLQESRLRNLANPQVPESMRLPHDGIGRDHNSINVFQQRPPGWGTPTQLMRPAYAARRFYVALSHVKGGWQQLPVAVAAQRVQRSAYPTAYAKWEPLARALAGQAGIVDDCATGPLTNCPSTGSAAEHGMTPAGLTVMRCAHQQFPALLSIGGNYLTAGPSDHANGRATDLMIPAWDTPTGQAYGWTAANWMRDHASALRIKYVIFSDHIWSPARNQEGWRVYMRGQDGSPSDRHSNHVHVSVTQEGAA